MTKKLYILILILVLSIPTLAQDSHHTCGIDEAYQELIRTGELTEEELKQIYNSATTPIENISTNQRLNSTSNQKYIIPIVFHIIHDCGPSNISDLQVRRAVEMINEDYSGSNADTSFIINAFKNSIGNTNIEFRLAQKDPNGNCTNGIVRVVSSLTNSGNNNVKSLSRWPNNEYLNIWVVETINLNGNTGINGYAYFPGAGSAIDGVVVKNTRLGDVGRATNPLNNRTLSHEIGHYLNLSHPWGGGNVGQSSNCSDDDGVGDTPNTVGSFGCNVNRTTCGSLDNVQNIMDYTSCRRMFTAGQATRMRNAAAGTASGRNNLWTEANLIKTGVCDTCANNPCAPQAYIIPCGSQKICQGQSVSFIAGVTNSASENIDFDWEFTGGSPATGIDSMETVVYNTPGVYPVKLKVSSVNGQDSILETNYIVVEDATPGQLRGIYQSFEDNNWPIISPNSNENWKVDYSLSTQNQLEVFSNAIIQGNKALRLQHLGNGNGSVETIIESPTIDASSGAGGTASIEFYYAHADQNANSTASIELQTSIDCGNSWQTIWDESSSNLLSTISGYRPFGRGGTGLFVPTSINEFNNVTVSTGLSNIDFKARFVINSGNGNANATYIDAFLVRGRFPVPLSLKDANNTTQWNARLYPNPAKYAATLEITLSERENISITLHDAIGKQIGNELTRDFSKGNHQIKTTTFAKQLNAGIYYIKLSGEQGSSSLPLVIK